MGKGSRRAPWLALFFIALIVAAYVYGRYCGSNRSVLTTNASSERFEPATSSVDEESIQASLEAQERAEEEREAIERGETPAPVEIEVNPYQE